MKAYPIEINSTFHPLTEKIPMNDIENGTDYTLKYWGYASFVTNNRSYYSTSGEVDINFNFFFKIFS